MSNLLRKKVKTCRWRLTKSNPLQLEMTKVSNPNQSKMNNKLRLRLTHKWKKNQNSNQQTKRSQKKSQKKSKSSIFQAKWKSLRMNLKMLQLIRTCKMNQRKTMSPSSIRLLFKHPKRRPAKALLDLLLRVRFLWISLLQGECHQSHQAHARLQSKSGPHHLLERHHKLLNLQPSLSL